VRRDRLTNAILAAATFGGTVLVASIRFSTPDIQRVPALSATQLYVASLVVAVPSAGAVFLRRRARHWPLVAVALLAYVALLLAPPLVVASYDVATTYARRSHLAAYAVSACAVVLLPDVLNVALGVRGTSWSQVPGSLGGAALFVGLPMAIGLWVSARRQALAGLRERAEELERSHAARAEQVRVQERARIAREMHDVVAHRVSLMVLRAGALEVNAPDESVAGEAALIRTTGRDALRQLRALLGVLRSSRDTGADQQPVLRHLDQLLEESRAAGVLVDRHEEGEPGNLPAMVEHTAYRVIQEALTNVHKHAGSVNTWVCLRYLPDRLEIVVQNDAPPRPVPPMPGSGLGLLGLRERIDLLDGEFTANREPDGSFTVSARLPLPARAVEESP
jgi:signal transduction histidine kinase